MGRLMNENVERITNLFRAVVADGGLTKVQLRDAIHDVAEQVQPLIDSGEVVPDTYSWVKAIVMAADKRDGGRADEILAALARGEDDLTLDVEPFLDYVVTLGRGGRKIYRHLTAVDLDEMDELRHHNVRSVNRSYHRDWKPRYQSWRLVLRRNPTIGAAVEAGDLPVAEAPLFGDAS
jgi:hypothetical protein